MKTVGAILLLLVARLAYTQTDYMDSLRNALSSNAIPDTQRVLLLANLGVTTAYMKPDSGIIYAQEGLSLARSIHFLNGEMWCKKSLGETMWIVGEYVKANELLLEVLKYAKSRDNCNEQIHVLRILSANNRDQENYEDALKYSYNAIELSKACTPEYDLQLELSYLETGSAYTEMNKLDSALYYLQKAALARYGYEGYNGFKLLTIGRIYAKMKNDRLALQYYHTALDTLTGTNNYKDIATVYTSIAKLYQKEGNTDSTIYYAKAGYDVAREGSFKKGVFETTLFLSEIYEDRDPALAFKYFKIATAAKDSIFSLQKTTQFLNAQFNEQLRQQEEQAKQISYQTKIRTLSLLAALGVLLLISALLYRNNRLKQKSRIAIEKAYEHLKATQAQLIQSEKMASLGELTAGIAHEIQNPLNFVNNFSEVNGELIEELLSERANEKGERDEGLEDELINDIKENEEKINHHGKRADAIVKGMLQHSRTSSGVKEPTDINALCNEYLRLAYHGLRAKDKSFNATMNTDYDETLGKVNVIPQDMGRVLLNLYNNAFYTVNEKKKSYELSAMSYEPLVSIQTKKINSNIEIIVSDNGNGIPQNIVDKIFQPFFTTKPTGEGTGLGLSLSYDILRAHGGALTAETKEGEGSAFIIRLPMV